MGNKRNRGATAAVLIGVTALGGLAVNARVAAAATDAAATHVTTALVGGRHLEGKGAPNGSSTSNAGYIGSASGTITLTLTITVPKFHCEAGDPPVFIGIYLNGMQGGNFTGSGGSINATCSGTTVSYSAGVFADDSAGQSMNVAAGDKVVFDDSAGLSAESYTVTDERTHASVSTTGTGLTVQNVQATTQSGYGDTGGFPTFKSIKYSAFRVDGSPFAALHPGGLNQVDGSGKVMVKAGPLSKGGFTLKFVADS